jgi:glutaredoxin
MIAKSGFNGVPQIEINGKMIVGFDKEAIERELEL